MSGSGRFGVVLAVFLTFDVSVALSGLQAGFPPAFVLVSVWIAQSVPLALVVGGVLGGETPVERAGIAPSPGERVVKPILGDAF